MPCWVCCTFLFFCHLCQNSFLDFTDWTSAFRSGFGSGPVPPKPQIISACIAGLHRDWHTCSAFPLCKGIIASDFQTADKAQVEVFPLQAGDDIVLATIRRAVVPVDGQEDDKLNMPSPSSIRIQEEVIDGVVSQSLDLGFAGRDHG